MTVFENALPDFKLPYPLETLAPLTDFFFLDIETTGFRAKSSALYLIGGVFYRENQWHTIQWFAERREEEKELLQSFLSFLPSYRTLVVFNGRTFDLPFLVHKVEQWKLSFSFDSFSCIDLYQKAVSLKPFLNLPGCKQKQLEEYLGIHRQDLYSGQELIEKYHVYEADPCPEIRDLLLLHNRDDLKGMLHLLFFLHYDSLFDGAVSVLQVCSDAYLDYYGQERKELILTLKLPFTLPQPLSCTKNGCYFSGKENRAYLKVPVIEDDLKYFLPNPKEYYYLPERDTVVLKETVGSAKGNCIPATRANCYVKRQSCFLPQWGGKFEPVFKTDYQSKENYLELTRKRTADRDFFQQYAAHVLQMLHITRIS